MPRAGDVVLTSSGRELRLRSVLGRGGQGAVFLTDDERRAVKVCWNQRDAAQWQSRIERAAFLTHEQVNYPGLRRFVLPRELLLPPWLGYEMPLLPSAQSISELVQLPREQPEDWYVATGGLKRRLGIAVRTSRALSALHAAGFVFGDLSASNVLTTSDKQHSTIRVIDCDNIEVAGSPGSGVYGTPGYWAPELAARRMRPDATTDDHSLAVLLHELVYLTHPLRGDSLLDEDPDEAEARVERGELPWVFAPSDESNGTRAGLPPELAASADTTLFQRFREAFGPGLRDRTRRPTAAALGEAAERLLRLCLTCPCCAATQLYRKQRECPWCGEVLAAPLLLLIEPDANAAEFCDLREARAVVDRARKLPEMSQAAQAGKAPATAQGFRYRNCVVEDGLVLTDTLLRPWRPGIADESPLARLKLKEDGKDGVELQVERDCGLLLNGSALLAGVTVRLRGADSLLLPGERGEPSCRLRLIRPRRGEP